jgi:chromosome segregation ATPase
MSFNVMHYLQPRKQAKAVAVSKLAEQLHAGETVDPDLIIHSLEQAGATEEQLQAEIDRLERVAKLRQQIADAVPAQKRLDAIDAEISKAADKLQAAAVAVQQVREKHFSEAEQLRHKIATAETATSSLLEASNLSAQQREEMDALQQASMDAAHAHDDAGAELRRAQASMATCNEEHPKAKEQAKIYRNTPDVQENFQRWENALAARTKLLAEAQTNMRHAADAMADAQRAEEAFRRSILGGVTR